MQSLKAVQFDFACRPYSHMCLSLTCCVQSVPSSLLCAACSLYWVVSLLPAQEVPR